MASFVCLLTSKIVSATDSLCKGAVVSGIERRTEAIVSPRGPDHHSVHFLRRDVQSAINEAVCCCVGMSPVKSSQNTASALGELPSREIVMSRSGILILMLWSLMACSFAFTMDRSALAPSAWDTAPSLDTYQRVFVNPALKDKIQVTGAHKILQTEDAKMSENVLGNQTREKRSTTGNVEAEMKLVEIKPISEIALAIRSDASDSFEENANTIITPRNVILLLIDDTGPDEKRQEILWKDYKERLQPFAIEGFLQSCHDKFDSANFSMDNTSVTEKKEKRDNCECALHSIEELLSWAKQVRGMTTGAISGSNFSFPFFPNYESSRFNKNNAKLEPHKRKRDSNDGWQVIDLSDRAKSVFPLTTAGPKTGGESQTEEMNYDVAWDIFDVFSKIRMAFFRSLFESLHRNDGAFQNEFSSRKSFSFKSAATNLIENTIRELKSVPNEKGYMLIAAAPKSEGAAVIDLLQREASPENTLFIVTQVCVEDPESVPFIAQGPNYRILQEAQTTDELPITIKKAMITRDCRDTGCMSRQRRDVPIVSRVPTGEIFSQELSMQKRVSRNKNAEKPSTVNAEGTFVGKEVPGKSSTSSKIPCGLATVLGVTSSILAKAAITSF
ncbi:PREDICTED: uncharacterized protein LOC105561666 isoform X2 [Vollenhovia emeryi]|uniref:uncharacterized protein LOC105561666 isoform X2 n=1 Tax=Vollenhovia emeryi TaxID=411798 RepID=UPI0005F58D0E|nr:PREDICTED: uncharacterized protein LOC105561666 isoform X2 [Vollenhovia emeryi]